MALPKAFESKRAQLAAVVALLGGLAIFITGSIYVDYQLPLHSDSWMHLEFAKEIVETGKIELNPAEMTYPSLYHAILAVFLLVGIQATLLGVVFPVITTFIVAFSSFLLVEHITKSLAAGSLAGVTVLLLKSSVMLLGYWFLVPSALGFALLAFTIYLFLRAVEEKNKGKWFAAFIAGFFATALIYPYASLILAPIISLFFLLHWKTLLQNRVFAVFYAVLGIFAIVFWQTIAGLSKGFEQTGIAFRVDLLGFITLPLVALALLGAIKFRKNKGVRLIAIGIIFLVALKAVSEATSKTYLIPYPRLVLFASFLTLMLSGLGLFAIYRFGEKRKERFAKPLSQIAIIAILCVFLATLPFTYKDSLYKNIEMHELPAMQWISENTEKDSVFLADTFNANAIRVIAGRNALLKEPIPVGNRDKLAISLFLNGNCQMGINYANISDYVYSRKKLECDYLEEKFANQQQNSFVYKVKK